MMLGLLGRRVERVRLRLRSSGVSGMRVLEVADLGVFRILGFKVFGFRV